MKILVDLTADLSQLEIEYHDLNTSITQNKGNKLQSDSTKSHLIDSLNHKTQTTEKMSTKIQDAIVDVRSQLKIEPQYT